MSASRQLAAIMFTDIVGYTALMGEDEQKAFNLLHKNRQIQQPLIKQFNGTWIKELGDGILASFKTATDAVLCAGAVQQACVSVPGLQLRIGIHLGEVVFQNNDVFGDSVNIASRLQALAPIGGIWISETVHKSIANKKGITSTFVRQETLKNVKEPMPVYEVHIENPEPEQSRSIKIESPKKIQQKSNAELLREKFSADIQTHYREEKKYPSFKTSNISKRKIIIWIIPTMVIVVLAILFIPRWIKKQTARNKWIPEIQKMAEANFVPPTKAFYLAKEAEKYLPKDSTLLKLWSKIARNVTIETDPAGAELYWKDYNDPEGEWKLLGKTPLKNVWFPMGFSRTKIQKKGFQTIYQPTQTNLKLDSIGKIPETMVKVYGGESYMLIVGLEHNGGKYVSEFLIDKYEVTNKEFKRFVDAGGYKNKTYWDYPFYSEEKEIPWGQAMDLFRDKTGRPGPAEWEVGNYPEGKDNNPVTGISWYEAMAYAKFVGKTLPNVYQWSLIADTWHASFIVPKSNFTGKGTVPVGSLNGISNWGMHDIAGNAREWCFNESDKKSWHYILGGGWNDPTYGFNDGHSESALDRSLSNGFRCVKLFPGDTTYNKLSSAVTFASRDYNTEKPVDDKTFNIFLRQYAYDHSPLNPNVTTFLDSSFCKIEKINLDAAYNKERLTAYLFLPKTGSPPYHTILFFPHAGAIYSKKFNYADQLTQFDFFLKSGRAVVLPVFKGTFERGDELKSDLLEESVFYKEHVISWAQDISRILDYLETRNDIMHKKFAFYSVSWGSEMAPIMCAVEPRFKVAVYCIGGLMMQKTFPEVDPLNFLPHVKIPVLMLNGKNDTFFPVETSQKPMFRLLGTNEKDKKMIVYEGGHLVPRSELVKESLSWFDKYLGIVK